MFAYQRHTGGNSAQHIRSVLTAQHTKVIQQENKSERPPSFDVICIWTAVSFYFPFFFLPFDWVCRVPSASTSQEERARFSKAAARRSPGSSFEKHHLQVWVASLTKVRCAHCEIIHTYTHEFLIDLLIHLISLPRVTACPLLSSRRRGCTAWAPRVWFN